MFFSKCYLSHSWIVYVMVIPTVAVEVVEVKTGQQLVSDHAAVAIERTAFNMWTMAFK